MKIFKLAIPVLLLISISSCKKYLDAKPDATLATPSGLQDLQKLLDYYRGMNTLFVGGTGILSDNYYLTTENWASISREDQRNYYLWQKDDNNVSDWSGPYNGIYVCNMVLESLKTLPLKPSDKQIAEQIQGAALFFRASFHYAVAQLFAKGYDSTTAASDPGIPLKVSTDITERATRSSVEKTYQQIISDFKEAAAMLPLTTSIKSRPCKAAAFGALARTLLAIGDYEQAYLYADSCLQLNDVLIDYNSLDSNAAAPFTKFNDEVIFQAISNSVSPNNPTICKIDSNLYASYSINDLRRILYFKKNADGTYKFKGDYDGTSNNGAGHSFTGIVTDEQYLIRAECAARLNKTEEAQYYVNNLLEHRFKTGTFIPVTTTNKIELLTFILDERRKELLFRGTRWTDLKRLNKDPRFAVTLTRIINGKIYQLPASEIKYVALIPKKVIQMSGMQQNP
jgi:hypothetical protein